MSVAELAIYPDDTEMLAEDLAREIHAGQLYHRETGVGFIEAHLEPAVDLVRRLGYGGLYKATTWLHDSVEDHHKRGITVEYLAERGVNPGVVEAVGVLTRDDDEPYKEYLRRLVEANNPLAIVAKFADSSANLSHSMQNHREEGVSDAKFLKRVARYLGNLSVLGPILPPRGDDGQRPLALVDLTMS